MSRTMTLVLAVAVGTAAVSTVVIVENEHSASASNTVLREMRCQAAKQKAEEDEAEKWETATTPIPDRPVSVKC